MHAGALRCNRYGAARSLAMLDRNEAYIFGAPGALWVETCARGGLRYEARRSRGVPEGLRLRLPIRIAAGQQARASSPIASGTVTEGKSKWGSRKIGENFRWSQREIRGTQG